MRDISKISLGGRARPAQVVDAAVVRDAVEPRADVDLARVGAQRAVGADEDVLQHVLRVLAGVAREHLAHVREEPLAIAVVQHAEGLVGTGTEERHELLVGAEPEQRDAEGQPAQSGRGT